MTINRYYFPDGHIIADYEVDCGFEICFTSYEDI